jgi:hypothetical protein
MYWSWPTRGNLGGPRVIIIIVVLLRDTKKGALPSSGTDAQNATNHPRLGAIFRVGPRRWLLLLSAGSP